MTIRDDQEEAVNSICSFPLYVVLTKPELRCSIEFFSKYFFFISAHGDRTTLHTGYGDWPFYLTLECLHFDLQTELQLSNCIDFSKIYRLLLQITSIFFFWS